MSKRQQNVPQQTGHRSGGRGGRGQAGSQRGTGGRSGSQVGRGGLSGGQRAGGLSPSSQMGCGGPSGNKKGGSKVEDYLHVVTDAQATLLTGSGNYDQLIKQKTGADVQFDPFPSQVPDTKVVVIHGSRLEIDATVRLINQKTGDQDLCLCLGTTDPATITGLCLFSDQLSDPVTPWDVSSDVLRELENWWQRRVAVSGPDSHMTCDVYKKIVARFCGPATTVTVPCTSPPRLSIKTLGQAVSCTGEFYTALITLFPEQVDLLNTVPPRLFVAGPPGTGKTVVLLLMGSEWLRWGHDVHVVSTGRVSLAACTMLYYLLMQTLNSLNTQMTAGPTPGQLHLLEYDMDLPWGNDKEKAVKDLSQVARQGSLHVIADEVCRGYEHFCDKLLTQVPRLCLWAASCFHVETPSGWQVEYLTRPLRTPPAVVREVKQDSYITRMRHVRAYSERGVPDHTDGPPVRRLYHRGEDHSGDGPLDCVTCGREVASFLHSLRVGVPVNVTATSTTVTSTTGGTPPPCLQWRDVLVLYGDDYCDLSGVVMGLSKAGIPVRVMDINHTEDVATARSDVVWMTNGQRVQGLERKVVVWFEDGVQTFSRLYFMSRCTSQLVIVSSSDARPLHD